MANDLISRKSLIDKLEKASKYADSIAEISSLCGVMALIDAEPTVDAVEVVRGEWIETKYHTWECGNCGFHPFKGYIPKEPNFNYCPNCGAKMDGDQEK